MKNILFTTVSSIALMGCVGSINLNELPKETKSTELVDDRVPESKALPDVGITPTPYIFANEPEPVAYYSGKFESTAIHFDVFRVTVNFNNKTILRSITRPGRKAVEGRDAVASRFIQIDTRSFPRTRNGYHDSLIRACSKLGYNPAPLSNNGVDGCNTIGQTAREAVSATSQTIDFKGRFDEQGGIYGSVIYDCVFLGCVSYSATLSGKITATEIDAEFHDGGLFHGGFVATRQK